ncbi:MAG: PaaI family thioesterase [Pseudomonadota bacterium]
MTTDINPAIGSMLKSARDWLTHEHSLFRSLNLEPTLIGKGRATFAVDLPAEFSNADGLIHGGLMTIIMDSIFGLAVFTALEELKPIATINLRADYLADTQPGARVLCTSECIEIRGDVAYVLGDVKTQTDNTLLAIGSGTFMVGTRGPAKGSRL